MANTAESRTTKRARALVSDTRVRVAIPAELLSADDGETKPTKRGLKGLLTSSIGPSADPQARVLAFTASGTVIMTAKSSNGGIPDEVSSQTDSFPRVVDNNDDGSELVIRLDGDNYRIGPIHRDTTLSAIEAARSADEIVEESPEDASDDLTVSAEVEDQTDDTDSAVELSNAAVDPTDDAVDSLEEPTVAPNPPIDSDAKVDEPSVEVEMETKTETETESQLGAKERASATAASLAASLKRNFLTDEFGEIEIETRSRPTMQCQRLLRDRYVYLAVPGKALPREGTEDPKGKFVLAFTDQGVMLFKPSRGNEALPRDVIGQIDSTPIDFASADYNAKEGGWLTVGARRYLITRPYVRSLTNYIAEHHGGVPLP